MSKKLSEMSLEELYRLFPIFLTEHKTEWLEWYKEEEYELKEMIPMIQRISHIGSTSVQTIWAKPIIDILVEVSRDHELAYYKDLIVQSGYICMAQDRTRISFNKGYTENGFAQRVFHLHLRYCGDNNELYFRDYLIEHPDIAKKYETLKLRLWKQYEYDRDAYTNAKSAFIQEYTEKAKKLYGNRYEIDLGLIYQKKH